MKNILLLSFCLAAKQIRSDRNFNNNDFIRNFKKGAEYQNTCSKVIVTGKNPGAEHRNNYLNQSKFLRFRF